MFEVIVELGLKAGIFARRGVSGLDRQDQRHQCLGDKAPTIDSETAALVRTASETVGELRSHSAPSSRAAARKALILSRSFSPRPFSTPDETSTGGAPERRIASGNSSAVKPPDSIHTRRQERPAIRPQSKARPLPPGSASGRRGGFASNSRKSATSSYRAATST